MSNVAKSIFIYSIYLFFFGAGMVLLPNALLAFLGFEPTSEVWIRVLGLFTFTTGIYYFYASRKEQVAFFKATIVGRLFFFMMIVVFVFVFNQSYMLALIGAVDVMGALWTYYSFKKNKINSK